MQVLLLQKPHVKSKFQWWKHVLHLGPLHGYFPKAAKTCLIVKPELLDSSKAIYEGSGVQVIAHGQRHLGAVIRSRCFAEEYVMEKVRVSGCPVCNPRSPRSEFPTTNDHAANHD